MLKIAICDDEQEVVRKIYQCVQSYGEVGQIDTYTSGESLVRAHKEYDVIFLDIDMKGMNGIRAGRAIRSFDKKVHIIYVTAYEDYRSYAFSVHAFGYLVKPVSVEAIHRQLKEVSGYMAADEPKKLLRFEAEKGIVELDVKEIYYFEYLDRKIQMKHIKGTLWMRGSITALGEKIKEHGFAMPHKSFVVNLYQVKAIKGYEIFMMDTSVIPLSQKKSVEFRRLHNQYLAQMI